ncbi:membrane anchor subunit of succinate dehydrogenase, Sdh4 [Savitreella phatthalungensis]
MFAPGIARRSLLSAVARPSVLRTAMLHTTRPNSIGPAGPQVIDGTINDPIKFPAPNKAHGSYHWAFERAISVAIIPLTIAPFAAGSLNPVTDALLVATTLIHSHIGFDACISDYVPKYKYGAFWADGMKWVLRLATTVVAIGFYEFETNDVGLTEAIKRIWSA